MTTKEEFKVAIRKAFEKEMEGKSCPLHLGLEFEHGHGDITIPMFLQVAMEMEEVLLEHKLWNSHPEQPSDVCFNWYGLDIGEYCEYDDLRKISIDYDIEYET